MRPLRLKGFIGIGGVFLLILLLSLAPFARATVAPPKDGAKILVSLEGEEGEGEAVVHLRTQGEVEEYRSFVLHTPPPFGSRPPRGEEGKNGQKA